MKDVLTTVINVVKVAKETGDVLAPDELQKKRLKICQMCEHFDGTRCQICKCFMSVKTKLLGANCPKGRWDEKLMEEAMFGEMSPGFENDHCCKLTI